MGLLSVNFLSCCLYSYVITFVSVDKILKCENSHKATEQYFSLAPTNVASC